MVLFKIFLKEMVILKFNTGIAIAVQIQRISRLGRIATIALLCAAALSFNVVYIQSIGSGIDIFSKLFYETIISIDSPHLFL